MDRSERRRRTAHKALRELQVRIAFKWESHLKAGYFKKWRAQACRCRKRGRGCSPKVVASMCHHSSNGYHPAVYQRHESKRVCAEALLDYFSP